MTAMLLAPGAGSDRNHRSLVAIEEALAPMPVVRFDFPYRKNGRHFPDRAPTLIACVVEEAAALVTELGVDADQLVLGGRSMGGRMCSMAVAEGLAAKGLVLLSYPLHPPGKPDKLRVEHLPSLDVPCLFVSGTRDRFGTPDELMAATDIIPGEVTHRWIQGKGHDLAGADDEIVEAIGSWLVELG